MKKYVKPDLYYENFELSVSVASCGLIVKNGAVVSDNGESTEWTALVDEGTFCDGTCDIAYTEVEALGYYGAAKSINTTYGPFSSY